MAVIVPLLYFARETVATAIPRASRVLTFVSAMPAPDPAFVVPLVPARKVTPKPAEPIAAFKEPPRPVPPVPTARVEPKPIVPEPRREMAPKPALPRPVTPPAVTVGTFAAASVPSSRTTDPARTTQSAGFDAPAARAPEMKAPPAVTGAFEAAPSAANARPGSDRAAVVADAGFGTANAAPPSTQRNRSVADAGFGMQTGQPATGAKPQAVRNSGFDAPPAPPAAAAQPARAPHIDVPVEILAKPTPAYTAEARALKLEGEVVLEVEFCARGTIKVLRVVRGLGHGLDESASRAAEAIRFKPAQSSGRPVDFRSTVHIVFRLA